jgi:hypothetical protein
MVIESERRVPCVPEEYFPEASDEGDWMELNPPGESKAGDERRDRLADEGERSPGLSREPGLRGRAIVFPFLL